MNTSTNFFRTCRLAITLLAVTACWIGPQQAGAAITTTQCSGGGGFGGVVNFGNCYVVDATTRSWSDAQTTAQALDPLFNLVSVHSAAENTYVASLLPSGDPFWIGLTDSPTYSTEGTFVWTDGTALDYTNWASGQPDGSTDGLDVVRFDNSIDQWLTAFDDDTISVLPSVFTAPISAVPVPAAVWLFGSGLLGLAGVVRRKRDGLPVNES